VKKFYLVQKRLPFLSGAVAWAQENFQQENRRHTSTKYFEVWKSSRNILSRHADSNREDFFLSSGECVTATRVVQKAHFLAISAKGPSGAEFRAALHARYTAPEKSATRLVGARRKLPLGFPLEFSPGTGRS
jgi:hypothetical protein